MDFGFDDQQIAFRDALRELLAKECPPEAVRAAWEAPPGTLDRSLWSRMSEMGVLSALVPEGAGGLGLDERSLVLMLEETGYVALPHPVVETAAVAAPLLGAKVPEGSMVATDLGGANVACAADADTLILHKANRPTQRQTVRELHAVPADDPGLELQPADTVDGARRACRVSWTPQGPSLVITDPAQFWLAFDRGVLGTSAQLLGLAQRMLDMTVSYVTEREQFGKPVGSFQAIKHKLADGAKELAFARPAVYRAAHTVATTTDAGNRRRDVSMAKAMASNAALAVAREALQCHGAIGYTVEADLHLYMKRTWALARAWGDAGWHRRRVAQALGLADAEATRPRRAPERLPDQKGASHD